MKKQIPVLDKDKQQKVWIKVRKIDRNFNLNEHAHRHTYEELIWIKSGSGSQLIDEETIKLQANTLYLISNGQIHNFLEGKNLDGVVIAFNTNYLKTYPPFHLHILNKLLNNFKTYNTIELNGEISDELKMIVSLMLKEYEQPASLFGKFDLLNSFLLILLTSIERYIRELQPVHKPINSNYKLSIYQEFEQLIDLNFTYHHDLTFYAKKLGVSSRNLTSCSKLYAGKPAKKLIADRIILEAKRLLTYTAKSLDEIAADLGFEETSYFIRLFRKKTNLTPRKYRLGNKEGIQ